MGKRKDCVCMRCGHMAVSRMLYSNPRASATVLRDMAGLSGTLRVMNLSKNNLGRDGSAALAEWLSGSFALTHLILSDASVDVSQVTQALLRNKVLSCSSLALLDLSRNKICANGCAYLGNVMHATTSLTCLVLVAIFRRLGIFHSFSPTPPHKVECDDQQRIKMQAVFDRDGELNTNKSWQLGRGGEKVNIHVQ